MGNGSAKRNTVSILIESRDTDRPQIRLRFDAIPWFPGMTVLQAMILAQAMYPSFTFRAVYDSFFGAFIDRIESIEDEGRYHWILFVGGKPSCLGASEALVNETEPGTNIEVEWKYVIPDEHGAELQRDRKRQAAR